MPDTMITILKNWPSYTILLVGIIAVFASFYKDKKDSEQSDIIEELSQKNVILGQQIKELSKLNSDLTKKFGYITEQTNILSKENLILSDQSQKLLLSTSNLVDQSRELIKKVDQTTTYNAAEHMQTGNINLMFNSIGKDDIIKFRCGKMNFKATPISFQGVYEGRRELNTELPFSISLDQDHLNVNMRILDLDNKMIVEVINNKWRLNSNSLASFNYDNKGFEVLDNRGNVAVNLQIIDNRIIEIHGIFVINTSSFTDMITVILLGADDEDIRYRYFGHNVNNPFAHEKNVIEKMDHSWQKLKEDSNLRQFYNIIYSEMDKVNIPRIFEYTGSDWLHKRRL